MLQLPASTKLMTRFFFLNSQTPSIAPCSSNSCQRWCRHRRAMAEPGVSPQATLLPVTGRDADDEFEFVCPFVIIIKFINHEALSAVSLDLALLWLTMIAFFFLFEHDLLPPHHHCHPCSSASFVCVLKHFDFLVLLAWLFCCDRWQS